MLMEVTDKRFTRREESLLKKAKGRKLLSVDAVLAAPPDNSWNTIRLHFEDFDIDLNNYLHDVVVDEFGTLEEFGLLSVTESSKDVLSIPEVGVDTTVFEIDEPIVGVSVVNDVAEIYGDRVPVAKLEYPQAVVFQTERGLLVLDKEVWFSETIVFKQGANLDGLLYDESVNWEDNLDEDPSTHFEFHIEVVDM